MEMIAIVVPYRGADRLVEYWAREESEIDFRREPDRATRCTIAFAAMELKRYLERSLTQSAIIVTDERSTPGYVLELQTADPMSMGQEYEVRPTSNGTTILGSGRVGTLYGAYAFLELQGWRWYAPGPLGESGPARKDALSTPKGTLSGAPFAFMARGFDFHGVSKESAELLIWMARNRLNLAGIGPTTTPLARKLGMILKVGGHAFEDILNPDRVLGSGHTLWAEHPDWYGLPADGIRSKKAALATQFCVSRSDLLAFLADELLQRLRGPWKEADIVDLWGFDNWGNPCACEACNRLGNGTDRYLIFAGAMRDAVNQACLAGRLDHDVRLGLCAYQGTATLQAPSRPIPDSLVAAGDVCTFFPINRCYSHDFSDETCEANGVYARALREWQEVQPALPLAVGEYYNMTRFEDLPVLFTSRLVHDIGHYSAAGLSGISYMHVPLVNWGPRTLTQVLYAQLAWNPRVDAHSLAGEFFDRWYGPQAAIMRRVYELVEAAWLPIVSWRGWTKCSVLSQLLSWDGDVPDGPLAVDAHFGGIDGAVASGRHSGRLLEIALSLLHKAKAQAQADASSQPISPAFDPVNPVQASAAKDIPTHERRVAEDRRALTYGRDMLALMTELAAYHNALRRDGMAATRSMWEQIELIAEDLDSYYVPIGFRMNEAGLVSEDALTRSGLRDTLSRCRMPRLRAEDGACLTTQQ